MWLLTAWGGVKRLFGIILRYPCQMALIVAVCASVWLWMGKRDALADLGKERAAHIATKANYTNAQIKAAELNAAKVALIERQYDAIAERTESEYEKRLTDNRAALRGWMRTKAVKGNSQSAGTSGPAEMPGEAVPSTKEAIVSVSDLEIAADNYSQLISLIEWAKAVGKVETNAP